MGPAGDLTGLRVRATVGAHVGPPRPGQGAGHPLAHLSSPERACAPAWGLLRAFPLFLCHTRCMPLPSPCSSAGSRPQASPRTSHICYLAGAEAETQRGAALAQARRESSLTVERDPEPRPPAARPQRGISATEAPSSRLPPGAQRGYYWLALPLSFGGGASLTLQSLKTWIQSGAHL